MSKVLSLETATFVRQAVTAVSPEYVPPPVVPVPLVGESYVSGSASRVNKFVVKVTFYLSAPLSAVANLSFNVSQVINGNVYRVFNGGSVSVSVSSTVVSFSVEGYFNNQYSGEQFNVAIIDASPNPVNGTNLILNQMGVS